jgi:hypothetical protein
MMDIRGEKLTGPNTMSSCRYLVAIFALSVPTILCTTAHHRYECPSPLIEGKTRHALRYVNVYDGPPENLASLIPVPAGKADMWDELEYVNAYLELTGSEPEVSPRIHAGTCM